MAASHPAPNPTLEEEAQQPKKQKTTHPSPTMSSTTTTTTAPIRRGLLAHPSENHHPAATSREYAAALARAANLDMDLIDDNLVYFPSERRAVSCGTVAIDLARRRILSVFNKSLGIQQLPKGRKDIGEGFIEAALRETREETGVIVQPLALRVWTRATKPTAPVAATVNSPDSDSGSGRGGAPPPGGDPPPSPPGSHHGDDLLQQPQQCRDKGVTCDTFSNEFLGINDEVDFQSQTANTTKTIFWYAATFDLDAARSPPPGTPVAEDKFEVCAYGIEETIEALRFRGEKEVVRKLVRDLELSGIKLGEKD